MNEYYLAVDIGASSGRHILGWMDKGKLNIEEVHRFENEAMSIDGHLFWDTEAIFTEILNGLAKCAKLGKKPKTMGVDTWGVDYALLDKNLKPIGGTYAYRDRRTFGMDTELEVIYPPEELYRRAGLQKMPFNTVFQLMAHKKHSPEDLEAASYFLTMPDYFHFLLTGEITNEYTESTTTQLLDVRLKDWDRELISKIGIDDSIFGPITMPGAKAGAIKPVIARELGFSCDIVLPCTHDTQSAFMAAPAVNDNSIIISSGTWSLMGCELVEPVTTPESMRLGFTNEGGYNNRYCYLKNIMGLWMIQSIRKELPQKLSYNELQERAESTDLDAVVDCNDNRFYSPESMIKEIQLSCAECGFKVPETPGEIASVIYNSLAAYYKNTCDELSGMTGKRFDSVNIVGGGSKDILLNRLTARTTGMPVLAGLDEATAIGNIMTQMITDDVFENLEEARGCVRESFDMRRFDP